MSNWKLVRLEFGRNPVHFGEVGIGLEQTSERVRSDTLFSAWVNAYARLFGKTGVESLLDRFVREAPPPVRMSSTFIYRKSPQIVDYLPKPLGRPRNYPEDNDLDFFKTYKKLKYLPLPIWKRWYQDEEFSNTDTQELTDKTQNKVLSGQLHHSGTFDYGGAFNHNRLPKVAIDRTTRSTNFYHAGFVQFAWENRDNKLESLAGLYFILHFPQEDRQLESDLQAALNLLGEEGLGGERSSGAGRFKVVAWEDLSETWQKVVFFQNATHYSLMSLLWQKSIPNGFTNESSYDLVERGGWIGSTFSGRQMRRKKVRMFAEGSIFKIQPSGQIADVTPARFKRHPIYRNGIALSLPIVIDPMQ